MTWLDVLKILLVLAAGSFVAGFVATWTESRILPRKRTNNGGFRGPGTRPDPPESEVLQE